MEESDPRIVVGEDIVYFWDGKDCLPVDMGDVDMFVIDRSLDVMMEEARWEVMAISCVKAALNIRDLVACCRDEVEKFADALSEAPGHNFIVYRKDPAIWGRTTPRLIVNADRVTRKWAEEQMERLTRTFRVMVPDRDW